MECRKCHTMMTKELMSDFMEPDEYKYTCHCGQECWKGETYNEIWMDNQGED